ncbi:flagellar filament capping protein FliD [Bacillus kwashiorkori]|uniref:flagellar filament capping protein FliD n=1 Tax=Bacillus kwashiorkori TaxID=1522318 RepID=UPI000781F390|nr:flagellar filament capping protein FliD [Bacillus kwashiorkori]
MVMRVTGLASGMNIDEIVTNLMKAESVPLNKYKQEKQVLEWQRDSYREINTLMLNFRSELTSMRLTSYYRTRTATSTNEKLVSATASSGAGVGSYTISKVKQLATAATKVNAGAISKSADKKIDTSKGLYAIKDDFQFTDSFRWQTGSVESKTIVTKQGEKISLELTDGVVLQEPTSTMTVTVNGEKFTVLESLPENQLKPKDNEVLVDKTTGELTFGKVIAPNSSIKVDYVTDKRVETKKVNSDIQVISLRGALEEGSVKLTIGDLTFEASESDPNKLVMKENGQVVSEMGEINYTDGKVTINQAFRDKINELANQNNSDTEPSDDNSEKPTVELKLESKHHYFSFDLTTHTSKGIVKENFLVQGNESLNTVLARVNNSNVGVTMFYDSYTDRVTMNRRETGNFNEDGPEIITSSGFLNGVLRFENGTESGGENAVFTINGLETQRTSNTFTMSGVTFSLNNTTDEPVTININQENDKLFENIKAFVDKYNEHVEKIQEKLMEPKYKDYKPLTDDERESLSDKQQEKWEEMAKSGLLKNDSILSSFISQARSAIYSPVDMNDINPKMKSLSAIGIKTTSDYTSAKIEINESQLKAAIAEDPSSIERLFIASGVTDSQNGIIQRLSTKVTDTMNRIRERAGSATSVNHQFTIGRQLNSLDSSIERFEDRLTKLETRYYAQFSAMEKAIQRANSQSMYLSQFFM